MTRSQRKTGQGNESVGQGVGFPHRGPGEENGIGSQTCGLGALIGGCSEAVDALPERGYTIHVASLQELSEMLSPEGRRRFSAPGSP